MVIETVGGRNAAPNRPVINNPVTEKVKVITHQNRRTNNMSGFSLVETSVALTIVSIMLTSLYGSFASGIGTVRTSRETLRANQIMIKKLEGIRLAPSTSLPTRFTIRSLSSNRLTRRMRQVMVVESFTAEPIPPRCPHPASFLTPTAPICFW
jgi:prepilin-type N-terminal cleavage/methylation domain-containing protein